MSPNDRRPQRAKPRRSARRTLTLGALLAALVGGWLLRDCVALGPGGDGAEIAVPDESVQSDENPSAATSPEQAANDADAALPCVLYLNSEGLRMDGATVTIAEAVAACRRSGRAELGATGAARSGTYDELLRALEQAGVGVQLENLLEGPDGQPLPR
ncbi:hypothetical protein [Haliangium ochraceum]|uniref:Uncharacterized protein n=1 Tax=Haliangium ochraceum (strain DSM 14365 / JCM 11303 / SMP-2) TaxID=502025 RepID=D0LY04_HALO1|nr:hypothetical protein [Haliangium ochraceum]ACY14359.1 hypothetical protein Hoch_1811 [Haliangium ochraceum DSM 14365]